ncbi:unnamed protein product [Ectocarpus sp. CCAP 1310/34]|nr:unnamed protein product [Ectocarpus sp. CCAP 1310/34]
MLGILEDACLRSFSEEQNISSFAGAGLWPVDGERAMGRPQGVGKRKERSGARPPVEDITVAISDKDLADNLGPRTVRELQQKGQCVKCILINTVMLEAFVKAKKKQKKLAITRKSQGLPEGGFITCDDVMQQYLEDERQKVEVEEALKEKSMAREIKRAAKEEERGRRAVVGRGRVVGRRRAVEGRWVGGGKGGGEEKEGAGVGGAAGGVAFVIKWGRGLWRMPLGGVLVVVEWSEG